MNVSLNFGIVALMIGAAFLAIGICGSCEYLSYRFDRSVELREIHLVNGYAKTPDLFQRNARIRAATVATAAGSATVLLKDTRGIPGNPVPPGPDKLRQDYN